jgi:hypothetical protein
MTDVFEGACLCGAVRWRFEGTPEGATACNCTACRRSGALWIYGHEGEGVSSTGETRAYTRRENSPLSFNFCPTCGNLVFWRGLSTDAEGRRRMGLNLRLAEPTEAVLAIPIDHFDGLGAFEDTPRDGKCVRDMWF